MTLNYTNGHKRPEYIVYAIEYESLCVNISPLDSAIVTYIQPGCVLTLSTAFPLLSTKGKTLTVGVEFLSLDFSFI